MNSTPYLCGFNPQIIKSQWETIHLVRQEHDYNAGILEILLSGSIGSSKSLIMAHIGITHCMMYPQARLLVGRKAMPQLKKTILDLILKHISKDLTQGDDYEHNKTSGVITFRNGSQIIPLSWADKQFEKFRSYEFSAGLIEEVTENTSEEFKAFHTEMIGRIGRIKTPETFVLYATNPEAPSHFAYDYFIRGSEDSYSKHVIYSQTADNPFLPPWYVEQLRTTYDAKMCQRLLYGKWIHINTDIIYYEYKPSVHYIMNNTECDKNHHVRIAFDFNIGTGKPMSSALFQYIEKEFIFIDEVILQGSRTINVLEEYAAKGYLDLEHNPRIIIHGDSTGRSRDTRSIKSDYQIIEEYLSNYQRKDKQPLNYQIDVPRANPPIRKRHNLVNGQLCDSKGNVRIKIDKRCKKLDEGLMKTKLVQGGSYIEDDSNDYQHITAAVGYGICRVLSNEDMPEDRAYRR